MITSTVEMDAGLYCDISHNHPADIKALHHIHIYICMISSNTETEYSLGGGLCADRCCIIWISNNWNWCKIFSFLKTHYCLSALPLLPPTLAMVVLNVSHP